MSVVELKGWVAVPGLELRFSAETIAEYFFRLSSIGMRMPNCRPGISGSPAWALLFQKLEGSPVIGQNIAPGLPHHLQSLFKLWDGPNVPLQPGVLVILQVHYLLNAHEGSEDEGQQFEQLVPKKYWICNQREAKRYQVIAIQ